MKYMLDTNICIHLLRGKVQAAKAIDSRGLQNCCISEITKAELLYGEEIASRRGIKRDPEILKKFLGLFETVPIGNSLELYAKEKARLNSEGRTVEDFDLLIGCSAVAHGDILVSENTSHMSRIDGIRLENWMEPFHQ